MRMKELKTHPLLEEREAKSVVWGPWANATKEDAVIMEGYYLNPPAGGSPTYVKVHMAALGLKVKMRRGENSTWRRRLSEAQIQIDFTPYYLARMLNKDEFSLPGVMCDMRMLGYQVELTPHYEGKIREVINESRKDENGHVDQRISALTDLTDFFKPFEITPEEKKRLLFDLDFARDGKNGYFIAWHLHEAATLGLDVTVTEADMDSMEAALSGYRRARDAEHLAPMLYHIKRIREKQVDVEAKDTMPPLREFGR